MRGITTNYCSYVCVLMSPFALPGAGPELPAPVPGGARPENGRRHATGLNGHITTETGRVVWGKKRIFRRNGFVRILRLKGWVVLWTFRARWRGDDAVATATDPRNPAGMTIDAASGWWGWKFQRRVELERFSKSHSCSTFFSFLKKYIILSFKPQN